MNKNKIVLNVGGKRFETLETTVKRIPDTLLGRITDSSPYFDNAKGEFFFDRDPYIFTAVLNLYRIGELHLPHNICGPALKRELLFWEIDEEVISECCWRFYKAFEEEQGRLVRIRHAFGFNKVDISPEMWLRRGDGKKGWKYWNHMLWRLLSDPTSSFTAKVWAWTFFLLLLLSITIQILRSEPELQSALNRANATSTDRILVFASNGNLGTPTSALRILEDILTVFFSIELSTRFVVCPEKNCFFKDVLNWIDMICVFPMVVILIMRIIVNGQQTNTLTYVSAYLSVTGLLRVLRLLKLIKHAIGFKILILTMKGSMKEILLLMGLISLCTVLFAVSVYFAEIFNPDSMFPSISAGLWWAIITMTTVGYGDMTPVTIPGRIVGTLCAMSGILATGLAIPVIASNFDKFYSDAQLLKQDRMNETRPKQHNIRNRSRDPFGHNVNKRSEGNISGGVTAVIVSPSSASEIKLSTTNGDAHRRFSLGFHTKVVPVDGEPAPPPGGDVVLQVESVATRESPWREEHVTEILTPETDPIEIDSMA